MKLSLLLLSLLAVISCSVAEVSKCNCTRNRGPQGRILGGTEAPFDTAYPSAVYFKSDKDDTRYIFCGGTILNELWIITAASCPYYEDTNPDNFENDIALVKLDSPLTFTPAVQPAKLAPKEFKPPGDKYKATVVGWGSVDRDDETSMSWNLRQLDVSYVDDERCRKALFTIQVDKHDDTDCFVSTETEYRMWDGPCDGDEGSPLYGTGSGTPPSAMKPQDHRLIGIVSLCNCLLRGLYYEDAIPSTYTAVRKYLWWLDRTLKANGYTKGIEGSIGDMSSAQGSIGDMSSAQSLAILGNTSFGLVGFIVSVLLALDVKLH